MTEQELYQLKYPIGEFYCPAIIDQSQIDEWIKQIECFPAVIEDLTRGLNSEEKKWSYRPGGWSIKQVVHHCADSHINSFIRFKWALTEERPTIKAYDENAWSQLIDGNEENLVDSIRLLNGLHGRWVSLLKGLTEEQLKRTFIHPSNGIESSLKVTIGSYAWHCNQHIAHIKQAIDTEGKYNRN